MNAFFVYFVYNKLRCKGGQLKFDGSVHLTGSERHGQSKRDDDDLQTIIKMVISQGKDMIKTGGAGAATYASV